MAYHKYYSRNVPILCVILYRLFSLDHISLAQFPLAGDVQMSLQYLKGRALFIPLKIIGQSALPALLPKLWSLLFVILCYRFFFLITSARHGLLPGKSTTTNLVETFNDFTISLDAGLNVDCIYLDFSKAFDCISHSELITKLYAYGVDVFSITWIKNF